MKEQDNIKKEYKSQSTNEIQNSELGEMAVHLNIITTLTNSI